MTDRGPDEKKKKEEEEQVHKRIEKQPLPLIYRKQRLTSSEASFYPIERLCFRGDDRDPKLIFAEGFQSFDKILITDDLEKTLSQAIEEGGKRPISDKTKEKIKNLLMNEHASPKAQRLITEALQDKFNSYEKLYAFIKDKYLDTADNPKQLQETVNTVITYPFESDNQVAVSKRFVAATMFPLSTKEGPLQKKESWIYVLVIREGFDVHSHGVISTVLSTDPDETLKGHLGGLYVDEIITSNIPSSDIIGAVKVNKVQGIGKDGYETGTYELGEFLENNNCTLPLEVRKGVTKFIKDEPKKGDIPQPSSGYKESDVRGKKSKPST